MKRPLPKDLLKEILRVAKERLANSADHEAFRERLQQALAFQEKSSKVGRLGTGRMVSDELRYWSEYESVTFKIEALGDMFQGDTVPRIVENLVDCRNRNLNTKIKVLVKERGDALELGRVVGHVLQDTLNARMELSLGRAEVLRVLIKSYETETLQIKVQRKGSTLPMQGSYMVAVGRGRAAFAWLKDEPNNRGLKGKADVERYAKRISVFADKCSAVSPARFR